MRLRGAPFAFAAAILGLGLATPSWAGPSTSVIQDVGSWIDARLGSRRDEAETNQSFVRLTPGFTVGSHDAFEERLRARVKLDLPNTRNRLSLLLLDEDDPGQQASSVDLESDRLLLPDREQDTRFGLQYVPFREALQHVSATVSVNSDLDPTANVRWRRSFRYGENTSLRLTLSPGWRNGSGFTTIAAADVDHQVGDGVVRASLQGQHEDDGETLGARLGYFYPWNEATLLGAFVEGQAAFAGPAFKDTGRFALLHRQRLGEENYYLTFLPFVAWQPEGPAPDVQYGFQFELDVYIGGGRRGQGSTSAEVRD